MNQLLEQIATLLLTQYISDIALLSHPWCYYTIVPEVFLLLVVSVKWIALTAPVTIPLGIIFAQASPFRIKTKK